MENRFGYVVAIESGKALSNYGEIGFRFLPGDAWTEMGDHSQ